MADRRVGRRLDASALLIWSRNTFWLVPGTCVLAAVVLGLVMPRLEGLVPTELIYPGGPEGARSFLASITSSMISITGLVFSITIVALQLAAGQFTSRVMRDFLRDRLIQWTLGIFVATFTYAMVLQRSVRGTSEEGAFVPALGISLAFLLVLASTGSFIAYIHHIANSIRIAEIVERIAAQTRTVIDVRYPPDPHEPAAPLPSGNPDRIVVTPRPGVIVAVDRAALFAAATERDAAFTMLAAVGDFRPAGAPLIAVHGECPDHLERHVSFDTERTHEQDVAFGFRQLVDIVERALSPALNDPTTAAQSIDHLHDLLRRIAARPPPPDRQVDDAGVVRLVHAVPAFADLLDLALEEVLHYGGQDPQTRRRLRVMLTDLQDAALPCYRDAVARRLAELPG
ncbi:MAG: DUF2254 domain-containing protein [Pseudonocardia sp.]|nr:DUF2254 domain-containing protein [Pseudonocardia sp.]